MNFELVTLSSENVLADSIAQQLHKPLIIPSVVRFADSEIKVSFENPALLAGKKVFIIQSTSTPVHDTLMHFLLTVYAVKAAGAHTVIGVVPYFGYSRHDAVHFVHGKGSLELIARLCVAAGIDEFITLDFHTPHFADFFTVPIHNVHSLPVLASHCAQKIDITSACIVAPDKGAYGRAQALARILHIPCISFEKERYAPNKTRCIDSDLHTYTRTAIIIDDIIDTGETALNVCYALHKKGFSHIVGYFIHPVLSEDAVQSIEHSYFDKIFVSNSIELVETSEKIEQFDVSTVLAEKIKEFLIG